MNTLGLGKWSLFLFLFVFILFHIGLERFPYSSTPGVIFLLLVTSISVLVVSWMFLKDNKRKVGGKPIVLLPLPTFIVLLLVIWTFVHPLWIGRIEYEYTFYYLFFLLLLPSLSLLMNRFPKQLPKILYLFLTVGAFYNIVVILLQAMGIAEGGGRFAISGSNTNPNLTALFLIMAFPALLFVYRGWTGVSVKRKRIVLIVWVLLWGVALYLLRCRTSLLGVLIMLPAYLSAFPPREGWKLLLSRYRWGIVVSSFFLVSILILLGVTLYRAKQASADGRLFLWRETLNLIAEHPLTGVGYGFFPREFAHHQVAYFQADGGTFEERMNATPIVASFNDYLEFAVNGGIPAGVLFLLFVLSLLKVGWRQRKSHPEAFAGVAAFAGMILFNYGVYAHLALFAFLVYGSVLLIGVGRPIVLDRRIGYLLIVLSLFGFAYTFSFARSFAQLKEVSILIRNRHLMQAETLLQNIPPWFHSEVYYRYWGRLRMKQRRYSEAISAYQQASQYLSTTEIYEQTAVAHLRLDSCSQALNYADTAYWLQPSRITPRFLRLQALRRMGNREEIRKEAELIVRMPVKRITRDTKQMKALAQKELKALFIEK